MYILILSVSTMMNLSAIVLAGGASSRLGFPKHLLVKSGLPILDWWKNAFKHFGIETYISCRQDQLDIFTKFNCIPDRIENRGPMESLIQARMLLPESSFLIAACDLLYIEKTQIEILLNNNDHEFDCIAFSQIDSCTIFPLFSIIHPSADQFINVEYFHSKRSLKKAISNSKVKYITTHDDFFLNGINTPEDLRRWEMHQ